MSKTLSHVCSAIVDCEHKTAPNGDGFALSVGTKAMKQGRLALNACKPVSKETFDLWTRRLVPVEGDLILAREAPVGGVIRVPNEPRVCLGQRTVLIRPDSDRVDARFLHYWLLGPGAQAEMHARAAGATVPHLNVEDIRALDVSALPADLECQRRIGSVLGAIDDLIENNRRRIALLEQMAQAIYREWFVHFRYPGHEDELVDSPLGPIPVGWAPHLLADVAAINREQKQPDADASVVYIDISTLGDRSVSPPPAISGAEAPGRARRALADGDIVWSMVRPGRRAHALLVHVGSDWIASTGLAVITPRNIPGSFLFESLSHPGFSDYLVGKEGGSAYPAVKPSDFGEAAIVVPATATLKAFDNVVSPMQRSVWSLQQERLRATELRDLLLPKLVTGAIDVSHLDLDALLAEDAA